MSRQNKKDLEAALNARGKIENINGKYIRGWVFLENGESPEIEVVINGNKLTPMKPNVDRPELQKKLGTNSKCGFSVEISDSDLLDRQKINLVEIIETNSGYRFGSDMHFYCPLVRKMTSSLKSLFFAEFYRKHYNLETLSNEEAFSHYLRTGIYLGYNPNPWFSSTYVRKNYSHKLKNIDIPILAYLSFESKLEIRASEYFDPAYYLSKNPDLSVEWGLLNHYVNYGHLEGRMGDDTKLPDIIFRETEMLSHIEPKLALYFSSKKDVLEYPILRVSTYIPRLIRNRYGSEIKAVVCVPYLSCGGADLISTYVLKAYQQVFGPEHVLLIVTDKSENAVPQWISEKTQIVYLDEEANFTSFKEKVRTLHSIIGLLSPHKVININSHVCWEMYRVFGRQLATVIDLYAYLFCFDYTPDNRVAGYIVDYIPKTLRYLKRVFCDNQTVIDDMQELYGFSQINFDVLKSVYVPIPDELVQIDSGKQSNQYNKKILWVSRLARQKRPEILLQIAEDMPDQMFVVYGPPGDSEVSAKIIGNEIANIEYRGVFGNISDLDLNEYSLFLNTSAWDGLPTILIQIMGAGLPIVTSNAGGISELVNAETGSLILNDDNPAAYSETIKSALINYDECVCKSKVGLEIINDRHRWGAFLARLKQIGAFENLTDSPRRIIPRMERRGYGG